VTGVRTPFNFASGVAFPFGFSSTLFLVPPTAAKISFRLLYGPISETMNPRWKKFSSQTSFFARQRVVGRSAEQPFGLLLPLQLVFCFV